MGLNGTACAFRPYPFRHGLLEDLAADPFPARVSCWNGQALALEDDATSFGFVFEGGAILECASGRFEMGEGMYFAVPGPGVIRGEGRGLVIARLGERGLFHLGGPVEERGRLRYIDGCTDTLLISPVMLGESCLNLLHIPPGTRQTRHTHPSFRAGLIVSGHGLCVTPEGEHPLAPGTLFVIPAHGAHSFHTQDEALRVIAFHPDSDFGPTHETHPMINRTLISTP